MPAITERSTAEPLLKLKRLNHGTLSCFDLAKTRKFYEEVLGLHCVQTSPASIMVSLNAEYVYAVVELPSHKADMDMLNHNGLEVETVEEVNQAYRKLLEVQDEWGIKVMQPHTIHGAHTCYIRDFDGNWWEIVANERGYLAEFRDPEYDMTGRHELDDWVDLLTKEKRLRHVQDPETRKQMRDRRQHA